MSTVDTFRENMELLLTMAEEQIVNFVAEKGMVEADCQRVFLLNRLRDLEHAVNGTEEADCLEEPVIQPVPEKDVMAMPGELEVSELTHFISEHMISLDEGHDEMAQRLVRYGLVEPEQFLNEMRERMADVKDGASIDSAQIDNIQWSDRTRDDLPDSFSLELSMQLMPNDLAEGIRTWITRKYGVQPTAFDFTTDAFKGSFESSFNADKGREEISKTLVSRSTDS